MDWIEVGNDLINLNHIKKITKTQDYENGYMLKFNFKDGHCIIMSYDTAEEQFEDYCLIKEKLNITLELGDE